MKILVIDDDEDVMTLMEFRFSKGGHELMKAVSGTEALQKIAQARPDLILCDVNIPEPNGIALCEQLKKDPSLKQIPFVLLSGSADLSEKKTAADAVMVKPHEWDALQATIDRVCKATR